MEHDAIVDAIDRPETYDQLWLNGLNCIYGKGDSFFGFINFDDHSKLDVWTAVNLGYRLGAEFVVFLATGYTDDELTGQRCFVYLVCDPTSHTLYKRPIRVADNGRIVVDGDRVQGVADGWLAAIASMAFTEWDAWSLGEQADLLRRAGHTVEVRT